MNEEIITENMILNIPAKYSSVKQVFLKREVKGK